MRKPGLTASAATSPSATTAAGAVGSAVGSAIEAEQQRALPLLAVWGKSRGLNQAYPLVCHLLDTAEIAGHLFDTTLSPSQRQLIADGLTVGDVAAARDLVRLIAGWHDVGKCSPGFQSLIPEAEAFRHAPEYTREPVGASSVRHDAAGLFHFIDWFARACGPAGGSSVARLIGHAIGGHHGTFQADVNGLNPGRTSRWMHGGTSATDGVWAVSRDHLFEAVADTVVPGSWRPLLRFLAARGVDMPSRVAIVLVTGLTIQADWLVSDTAFIEAAPRPRSAAGADLTAWLAQRSPALLARVQTVGLQSATLRHKPMADQFPSIASFEPRGVQKFAAEIAAAKGPGLHHLGDQTGGGKTEAAFHVASAIAAHAGASGVLVALPTMATTDAAYKRFAAFCAAAYDEPVRLNLMHSQAFTNERFAASFTRDGDSANASATTDLGASAGADDCCSPRLDGGDPESSRVSVTDWLRGYKRGLLAPNTVCTIDQILAVAVAAKWMPLSLVGLTRRIVIIDEVHAYDAHMQALLLRLVSWLAACRVSVVTLSATLPVGVARSLADAYRDGLASPATQTAVQANTQGASSSPSVLAALHYPGWIHVSASDGTVTTGAVEPDPARSRTTSFVLHSYPTEAKRRPDRQRHANLSSAAARVLGSVLAGGAGNALVVTNTVQAAIEVHAQLCAVAQPGVDVSLMHARFPNATKRAQAQSLEARYGSDAVNRPRASVVVATQIVEQSLDVDFDVVLSELAPISLLLQREGRGHRHQRANRPSAFGSPVVHVLAEVAADGTLVSKDERPYDMADLTATWQALTSRASAHAPSTTTAGSAAPPTAPLAIPGQVQQIVDEVYDRPDWTLTPASIEDHISAISRSAAQSAVARAKAIPPPRGLTSLDRLTTQDAATADFSTRYGMNAVAVLPVWRDAEGAMVYLSPQATPSVIGTVTAVPSTVDGAAAKKILDACVSISPSPSWAAELQAQGEALRPAEWTANALTARVIPLLIDTGLPGGWTGTAQVANAFLSLNPDRGLSVTYRRRV